MIYEQPQVKTINSHYVKRALHTMYVHTTGTTITFFFFKLASTLYSVVILGLEIYCATTI